jgi:hypothetical protein
MAYFINRTYGLSCLCFYSYLTFSNRSQPLLFCLPNNLSFQIQVFKAMNFVLFCFYCCAEVYYNIYKNSYNLSLVSPPPTFSFILLPPIPGINFNRSHFSIFIHEYIFLLHSSSYTLSLYPPPRQDLFYFPVIRF